MTTNDNQQLSRIYKPTLEIIDFLLDNDINPYNVKHNDTDDLMLKLMYGYDWFNQITKPYGPQLRDYFQAAFDTSQDASTALFKLYSRKGHP